MIVVGAYTMTKAIYLTNYPLVTLFKSCNLLSVIFVGLFCSRVKEKTQKLEKRQLVVGLVVTLGVILYYLGPIQSLKEQEHLGSYLGVGLLVLSLVFDGLIPDFQAELKTKYKPTTFDMFEHINKWKTIIALAYSVFTLEVFYFFEFFVASPKCLVHIMVLALTGSAGQIFVYWLINSFRQHVVPFIITTRKIITVAISILYFGHNVGILQVLGILIVFFAVFF